MASTYPHYPYFWAAYGITAVILVAYAVSLLRRRSRTTWSDASADPGHPHDRPR